MAGPITPDERIALEKGRIAFDPTGLAFTGRSLPWTSDGIARVAGSFLVLREHEAVVVEVRPFDLHGVTYHDVALAYPDRTIDHARLGPEGLHEHLQPGEIVLATRVTNMVVQLRRPSPEP